MCPGKLLLFAQQEAAREGVCLAAGALSEELRRQPEGFLEKGRAGTGQQPGEEEAKQAHCGGDRPLFTRLPGSCCVSWGFPRISSLAFSEMPRNNATYSSGHPSKRFDVSLFKNTSKYC